MFRSSRLSDQNIVSFPGCSDADALADCGLKKTLRSTSATTSTYAWPSCCPVCTHKHICGYCATCCQRCCNTMSLLLAALAANNCICCIAGLARRGFHSEKDIPGQDDEVRIVSGALCRTAICGKRAERGAELAACWQRQALLSQPHWGQQ
eukprot:5176516-Pleurochrysis_carterae.AAC.2